MGSIVEDKEKRENCGEELRNIFFSAGGRRDHLIFKLVLLIRIEREMVTLQYIHLSPIQTLYIDLNIETFRRTDNRTDNWLNECTNVRIQNNN